MERKIRTETRVDLEEATCTGDAKEAKGSVVVSRRYVIAFVQKTSNNACSTVHLRRFLYALGCHRVQVCNTV